MISLNGRKKKKQWKKHLCVSFLFHFIAKLLQKVVYISPISLLTIQTSTLLLLMNPFNSLLKRPLCCSLLQNIFIEHLLYARHLC